MQNLFKDLLESKLMYASVYSGLNWLVFQLLEAKL